MNKKYTFHNWYGDDIRQNPHKYHKGFVTVLGFTVTLALLTSITCVFLKKGIELLRIYRTKEHLKIVSNAISNYAANHGILPYPSHNLKKGHQAPLPNDENDWQTNQQRYTRGFVPYATLGISKEYAFDGNRKPIIYYLNPTLGKRGRIKNAPLTEPLLLASNTTNSYYKIVRVGPQNNAKQPLYLIKPEEEVKQDSKGLLKGEIIKAYSSKVYTNYLYCRYSDDPENKNDFCAMTKSNFGLMIYVEKDTIEIDEKEISIHKAPGLITEISDIKKMEEIDANPTFQKPIDIIAFALVSYKEKFDFPLQPNLVLVRKNGDQLLFVSRSNINNVYNSNNYKPYNSNNCKPIKTESLEEKLI